MIYSLTLLQHIIYSTLLTMHYLQYTTYNDLPTMNSPQLLPTYDANINQIIHYLALLASVHNFNSVKELLGILEKCSNRKLIA